MPTGAVKWFDSKKGYGFITQDGAEDIFVHWRNLEGEGFKTLEDGDKVEFEVVRGDKGLHAEHVVKVQT